MLTTTLNRIRDKSPCSYGWAKLLAGLGKTTADDDLLPFSRIVKINGIDDALWCCRAEPQHAREWRLFAVWCARQVEHLMTDQRSRDALDVAERHANGEVVEPELDAARAAAAEAVAWATASAVAEAVAWATVSDAANAAWAAAEAAAEAAANAAARAAVSDAANAAANAAWAAAGDAARAAQTKKFLEIVGEDQ